MNKVVEAPETIFVNYRGFGVFDEPIGIKMQASQIEYVRKDAFIEKACDWLKTHINDYLVKGRDIDYIFDDFRKAMEN